MQSVGMAFCNVVLLLDHAFCSNAQPARPQVTSWCNIKIGNPVAEAV